LKSPISINIVVNKINYKSIIETVLFYFRVKQIKDIRINFIRLSDDVRKNWNKLKISYNEFLPYLKKLIYISLKYSFRLTFDTIPACIFHKIDNNNYKKLIERFL
jgi:sulfatase maturation enzyme AslB (radical SAM superfamily)